jgi:hypothetical protein
LEEQIPRLLHQESNREVVSGIWLDVRVSRGPIELRVHEQRATLSAPILLDLDARSRLGPILVRLGQCRSSVDFELESTTALGADGKLPHPTGRATVRVPCRLSGFDVTPIVEREIHQRLATMQEQITERVSGANAFVSEIHEGLFRRLSTLGSGCLHFIPEKLRQSPVVEEQGAAVVRLAVRGLVVERCGEPVALPVIAVEATDASPRFELSWPRRIAFTELGARLTQILVEAGQPDVKVEVRSVRQGDVSRAALLIRAPKHHGTVYASPQWSDLGITLVDFRSKDARLLAFVRPLLEKLKLPVDFGAFDALVQEVVATTHELTPILGQSAALKERYLVQSSELRASVEVQLEQDALVVVARRSQATVARE